MFSLIKKAVLLFFSIPSVWGYCLFSKNQECKVRKVIIDDFSLLN